MMCSAEHELLNIAAFPMKKPEMQIGDPEITSIPDVENECEYARNDTTWD